MPVELPAVNVVEDPVVGVKLPSLPFMDQTYAIPEGQVALLPPLVLHAGVAMNFCELPVERSIAVGVMLTPLRTTVEVSTVTETTTELSLVVPLSVALTKMPPVMAADPAVKVVVVPLVGLILPSAVFVSVHTYVTSGVGQVEVHRAAAVKAWVLPEGTLAVVGLIETEFSELVVVVVTVITV
jgi:hypothetical protein